MRTFGLIGYPLTHSFSKRYFSEKFENEAITDCSYALFPLETISGLRGLIEENPSLCGLNITIPYKVSVIPYLNELDTAAEKIGAVNCIVIKRSSGKPILKGYNTDAAGFERSLKPLLRPWHSKAIIFGNGGASKAVQYVLTTLAIPFIVCSRGRAQIDYAAVTGDLLSEYTILINTTPLGMYPNTATSPAIPYPYITDRHLAYDLVYNPTETLFLNKAGSEGAIIKNGMEMLCLQAEESWYIWNSAFAD